MNRGDSMRTRWLEPPLIGTLLLALMPACVANDQTPPPTSSGSERNMRARVERKVSEFQERAPAWVAAGGDAERLSRLGEELDRSLKDGKLPEAEKTLDEMLGLLNEADSVALQAGTDTKDDDGARVRDKAQQLQQKVEDLLRADKVAEAEEVVDDALDAVNRVDTSVSMSAVASAASHYLTEPISVRLAKIPAAATIVYQANNYIYVMNADGSNVTRITFEHPRHWEHVAVSHDHRWAVANEWTRPSEGGFSSRLWLFDLEQGTERQLVPDFSMAGNGGVDWDPNGFIYFAGSERDPRPNPSRRADFIANAAAHDIYKIKYDGSGLQRLTTTTGNRGEADVSVSEDGRLLAYVVRVIDPPNDYTEIWVINSDGTNPRLVYKGGKVEVASVHDPEISPDNKKLVFSKVNPDFKNFPNDPRANTAHDIYSINIDGSGLKRLTRPGPISIIPDWRGDQILYLEITDKEQPPYLGLSLIQPDGSNHKRIRNHANIARWIP